MKKILSLTAVCALFVGAIGLSSCEKKGETGLPKPTNLQFKDVTDVRATLTWDAVTGAEEYTVTITGLPARKVKMNTYTAGNLTAETDYEWTVQAHSADKDSDIANGPKFTTEPAPEPLAKPTNLASSDVTSSSAVLTWSAVEGATGYEVKIGNGTAVPVTETTYTATGLSGSTTYAWAVRATEGSRTGEWAESTGFTTEAKQLTFTIGDASFEGNHYFNDVTAEHRVLSLNFFESEPIQGYTGMAMELTVVFDGTLDLSKDYIDIPARTYNILTSATTLNTIWTGGSSLLDYSVEQQFALTSGTMKISGDHTDYTVEFNLTFQNGATVTSSYEGTLGLSGSDPIDVGTMTLAEEIVRQPANNDHPDSDVYMYLGLGEGTYLSGQNFAGTGFVSDGFDTNSGATIPNGTYTISGAFEPGTAYAGWQNSNGRGGCWLIGVNNNQVQVAQPIKWGTFVSNYSANAYTITISGKTPVWQTVNFVIISPAAGGASVVTANAYSPYKLDMPLVAKQPQLQSFKATSISQQASRYFAR